VGFGQGMSMQRQVMISSALRRKQREYPASKEWPIAYQKMVAEARQLQDAAAVRMAGRGVGFNGGVQAMWVGYGLGQ
jgi:hypothetical protein